MTASNPLLALHTKLLVTEYGRKRVIEALAEAEDVGFETIERELDAVRQRKANARRRPKTLPELLKEAKIDQTKLPLVERIARAYDHKRYLPDLWRVRRFLESCGVDASKVRTRRAALRSVIEALGGLTASDLTNIEARLNDSARGDLGIIADQILGPSSTSSQTNEETDRERGQGNATHPI